MLARKLFVRRLMDAAMAGVDSEVDDEITADEVLLCYINLAKNSICVARRSGADMTVLQHMIELILIECYDPNRSPN